MQQTTRSGTQAPGRRTRRGRKSGKGASSPADTTMLQPGFQEAQAAQPGHMSVCQSDMEMMEVLPGAGEDKKDLDHVTGISDRADGDTSAGGSPTVSECNSPGVAGLCIYAAEIASNASTPTSTGVQPEIEPPEDVYEDLPRTASGKRVILLADKMPFASVLKKGNRLSTRAKPFVPLVDKLMDQIPRPPPGLAMPLNAGAKSFVPRCDYPPTAFPCSSHMAPVPQLRSAPPGLPAPYSESIAPHGPPLIKRYSTPTFIRSNFIGCQ